MSPMLSCVWSHAGCGSPGDKAAAGAVLLYPWRCFLHWLHSGDKGGLCWGHSAMELQDKNQAKWPQDAVQVPRRNAADSSPIYSDVLRAGFWLGSAAVLLPEAKQPDFTCAGILAVLGGCSLPVIL